FQCSACRRFARSPLSIQRYFAAVSAGCNSLSISELSSVFVREYSRYVCFSFVTGDNVAFVVQIDLSLEYRSVRFVANCHKHPVRFEKLFLSSLEVFTPNSRNVAVSQYFFHDRIPDEVYLRILYGTFLHYLTGS